MWERPRPIRTEIVVVDSKKLARHALAAHFHREGFVRLKATGAGVGAMLTIVDDDIDVDRWRDYYWFRSQRDLDAVLHEMVTLEAVPWTASPVEGGVLVFSKGAEHILDVFTECGRWCQRWWVPHSEIEKRLASIEGDVKYTLAQLQITGRMAALNHEYKALRQAPRAAGAKLPSYRNWATARLEAQILQLLKKAPEAA